MVEDGMVEVIAKVVGVVIWNREVGNSGKVIGLGCGEALEFIRRVLDLAVLV